MGKAGKALKQVLETYGISQNRLAVTMGIGRSTVHYWFNETQDPSAEAVTEIIAALQKINEDAAKDFVRLYLGQIADEATEP
ncbi:MAG: helix-turn-helix transcriptional regulator [Cyanobacteria bacterium CRU_2_1]|nr:helix-turn-helix transcriptional regulator [Cyanobacteria bacterium RU_5_0]NJR58483.1 helix-turn-helix transcriptional regulator [Cyanobacteria bacterium CRU_2_1]NJR58519.1 helix-turn-helix transcriptional regulator [Cyanobacteria bacterium CRU_2_1]